MDNENSDKPVAVRKVMIFAFSLPLMAYAFPTAINNIFGVDITGGWMGDRDPVGAGYVVVLGFPVYIYYFFKAVMDVVKLHKNQRE